MCRRPANSQSQSQSQSQPQQPAKSIPVAMAPAKATPQAIAPVVQYVQPTAQAVPVQYVRPPAGVIQPIALTLTQPVATIGLKQPCHFDKMVSAVGLRLYQRRAPEAPGDPRGRHAPGGSRLGVCPPAGRPGGGDLPALCEPPAVADITGDRALELYAPGVVPRGPFLSRRNCIDSVLTLYWVSRSIPI